MVPEQLAERLAPAALPEPRSRWRPRLGSRARVIAISLAISVLGLACLVAIVPGLDAIDAPLAIPLPAFSLLYLLAEAKVLDVHFRGEKHSLSLSEIPVVLGLYFVDPVSYVVGITLGGAAALLIDRQPPIKVLFNFGHFLSSAVISVTVFHLLGGAEGLPGPIAWAATFAATLSVSVFAAFSIALVISASGAAPQFQKLPQMLQSGALFAVTNTSMALLAVTILWFNPIAIWLLAIPVATLFVAYQAYLGERHKHESLELLYESSRIFQRSPELDSAMLALLEHVRNMFRTDVAQILLTGPEGLFTTSVGPGDRQERMTDGSDRDLLARAATEGHSFVCEPPAGIPSASAADRLFRQALVSPLRGESGLIGAILVSDRAGDAGEFTADDHRLLDTVANQAAVALENGRLEQSLAELSRLKEELRHQAYHDALTGLPNRVQFIEQVEALLALPTAPAVPVVLFLDLDNFKVVNDTLGHALGDRLLQEVADRLRTSIRSVDVAARLGGDEFGILLSDTPELADALRLADRIIRTLRVPFLLAGQDVNVGASIGVAAGPAENAAELLRNADVAMYTAKARGKARVSVFAPEMHAAIIERHELSRDLAGALSRGEIALHYQPIIELATGRTTAVEALVRWHHPTRGYVPPDIFIPLAEESGAILELGDWILSEGCRQAAEWAEAGGPSAGLSVTINLSPLQIHQPGFIERVLAVLDETGADPGRIVLEVTETAMFRDLEATIRKLERLREQHIRIAVDDFGTGYSSLGYLRRFPIDILKIAREFVGLDEGRAEDWVFARAIVALGRALDLTIIGEGIERVGQAGRLRDLGCDLGQGYLYSRPMPAREIPDFLRVGATPTVPAAPPSLAAPLSPPSPARPVRPPRRLLPGPTPRDAMAATAWPAD
ncbi:MAG TPA: EAL domain-containing protein [Candidatus Limnocylindrales bacterium]